MAQRQQFRRVLMLTLLILLAFAGLGWRLLDIQVVQHEKLTRLAEDNTQREFVREPRRGDILDIHGNPLATSIFVKTVCADPTRIGNHQTEVARVLAPLLELPESELVRKMAPRTTLNDKGQVIPVKGVVLKRKVAPERWQLIKEDMARLSFGIDEKRLQPADRRFLDDLRKTAIFTEPIDDQLRTYPNQKLAAHVLGYVGVTEQVVSGKKRVDISGKDGIELAFDKQLRGASGWRVTEIDAERHELVLWREQDVEARDGLNLVLTIDSVIQNLLESALAEGYDKHTPVSISGIVVRPRTGEILAMATLPNFDPGNLNDTAPESRRNRIITDAAEPGSTFKVVVVSGALQDQVVKLTESFDCERGRFPFAGHVLHDHESYGILTTEQIITKSSNIGAAKIGIRLGPKRLSEYIHDYGFGAPTEIPLPRESRGIVYPPSKWSKVTIAQIPMGHGIAVTPLQMTMAVCAIANQGWLMRPMVVDHLEDSDHRVVARYAPQRVRQVIGEGAARNMVKAMKTVVSTNGTAAGAALEHYTVAGKTGTAQKVENGTYVRDKHYSSFVGFFPADNPELCVAISLDEPKNGYYGGKAAAPVFKRVAEQAANYLNIPPDIIEPVASPDKIAGNAPDGPIRTAAARAQVTNNAEKPQ